MHASFQVTSPKQTPSILPKTWKNSSLRIRPQVATSCVNFPSSAERPLTFLASIQWPSDPSTAKLRESLFEYYGEVLVLGRQMIRSVFVFPLEDP